jgi:hypothetical protein
MIKLYFALAAFLDFQSPNKINFIEGNVRNIPTMQHFHHISGVGEEI